jgi:hypothetical protein
VTPFTFTDVALTPGLSLLPAAMDSPAARAMVLAICLQESDLQHRRQQGHGPARGYAQFEQVGVAGVLMHQASRLHAVRVCEALDVPATPAAVHAALEYHDVLTVAFARLLLWTHPDPLPPDEHHWEIGWAQYLACWRPGKPRREKFPGCYGVAWDLQRHPPQEIR